MHATLMAWALVLGASAIVPAPAPAQQPQPPQQQPQQAEQPQRAAADGEAAQVARGQRLFIRCVACHEPGEPKVAKVGPHMRGIFGRQAGGVAGYNYSKGLAAAGFAWDDAKLLAWLERPTALVPDTSMAFEGISAEADRRALLAYLRTLR